MLEMLASINLLKEGTNMNEEQKTLLGFSIGCLTWIGIGFILVLGSAVFTVWYNYHIAVPVENSNNYVKTCSTSYLDTQKVRIENDLDGISRNEIAIASTSSDTMKGVLKAQEQTNADDIYNALDASHCSRVQLIQDMPELSSFYQKFPTR